MLDKDKNIVLELCKGQSQEVQNKIKAAYWHGCVDGLKDAKTTEDKVERRENNVVYLKILALGKPKKLR